jgi:anhydro-N-acetylmuramic acid kinase
MGLRLRLDAPHPTDPRRWVIGVSVSSDCARLAAVVVAAVGDGLELRADIGRMAAIDTSPETAALFGQLAGSSSVGGDSGPAALVATLRAQLADVQASLVADLLGEAGLAPARVLAVGVHDPGLWSANSGYVGLCDAARLAESSGLNVIDAFPARDVACGGQGGPVTALAQWILLKHPTRNRLLLDLGRTVRMSFLPAEHEGKPSSEVLSFEVGPGMRLLDHLTSRLTGGEHRFDLGGRLAVQGRRIPELVEHWLEDPYFKRPPPRWHPRGVRPERFLLEAIRMAVDSGWSVRDLLCTATHFIADQIALSVRRWLPENCTFEEIVLCGGGQHNGMLLREIASRLRDPPVVRITDTDLTSEVLDPAAAAVLALLHLDHVPANHPMITGAEVSRVLGRLSPGSPQSWHRLLHQVTRSEPTTIRPLRSAI